MKVPLSWLADFVEIGLPVPELSERLTFAGLEVAGVSSIGEFWDRDKVLVGEITSVEPHPNADRLTLPTVSFGEGRSITVVTGAPNIRVGEAGMKVPLALEGSRLIDAYSGKGELLVLKKTKLRGVESRGMVCSERELGLSDEHEGIMLLPDDAPVGSPLADLLGDTVLDIDLTPNLSRCLSILGVAREVAAITGSRVKHPKAAELRGELRAADLMAIEIEDPGLCARYCGTFIGSVGIGPSPFLVARRLSLAGMRPINNVVDATNYVMFELGQPLHAFDYAVLKERAGNGLPRIIVRSARPGETITTLDGARCECGPETLLITDESGPIAVAGVMGGLETEVREGTTEILLESANFQHASVRRTAQRLRLPSEASLRFGKGLPASLAGTASVRATRLIAELTGGTAAAGMVDTYPRKQEPVTVVLNHHEFSRILGYRIPEKRVFEILENLEFSVAERGGELIVGVPEHRLDVEIPADLVEEVARIEGYDRLPATLMKDYLPPQSRNEALEREESVRDQLVAGGLQEIITYALTDERGSREWLDLAYPGLLAGRGDFLRVVNPLSEDRTVLRMSLLPGMLQVLRANTRFQRRVPVFEIGRVFHPVGGAERPEEPHRLGVLLWGLRREPWWGDAEPGTMDFFDVEGIVRGLLDRLNVDGYRLELSDRKCLQAGRGAEVFVGEQRLGFLGELSPEVRNIFDLGEERVCAAELELSVLIGAIRVPLLRTPSRFPAVTQDLAVVVDEDVSARDLEAVIRASGGGLLAEVRVFDVYRGPQVPEGKKSLAFTLEFQATDRTLTEEEASARRVKIVSALSQRFDAVLRGGD